MNALPLENECYTYADYLTWDNDIRYELIEGIPYAMAGVSLSHMVVRRELEWHPGNYLDGKSCQLFSESFDLILNIGSANDTVVKPDIFVVCDQNKLEERGCVGTPDLIIEVLSPWSVSRDKIKKLRLYEKVGVPEYWIVDPLNRYIDVYILKNGKYNFPTSYNSTDTISVNVLKNCCINLEDIFKHLNN
ncbi:MAG: Uma2 family endonuclease [Defluviitaleaceae bacterium]|nr:Uma2 family endonuclease [Defluviitaleaceae bacterium]